MKVLLPRREGRTAASSDRLTRNACSSGRRPLLGTGFAGCTLLPRLPSTCITSGAVMPTFGTGEQWEFASIFRWEEILGTAGAIQT
jgi:hypothetical protein